MPTRKERDTVAKLMLAVVNAFDETRRDGPYAENEPHPEFTLNELRPLAKEALDEAQQMLVAWGAK